MKLHEIDWTDGKEYLMSISTNNDWELVVNKGELFIIGTTRRIENVLKLSALLKAEFTEMVEPVTFLEAYQGCLANGTTYADKHNICTVRRDSNGKVELKVRNTVVDYTVVCVGRMEFTKVVD